MMQAEPGIPRKRSIFPGRAPHPPRPSRRWGAGAALVVLAAVLGIATPEDARAQTPPSSDIEREALTALYNETGGTNWTSNDNWLDDDTELRYWHGVTTNTAGKVTGLTLRGNNLSGSLPAKLGNLVNLTHLYLHQNALSGAIPPELGNLVNLTHLYLYQNALSGSLPVELGNLVNLTHLYLYQNALSGSLPVAVGEAGEPHASAAPPKCAERRDSAGFGEAGEPHASAAPPKYPERRDSDGFGRLG